MFLAVYKKNRQILKRAYPYSLIGSRIFSALFTLFIPYTLYYFIFEKQVSADFLSITNHSEYLLFIVLGCAINILGMSTLMNVGRSLITEIREGTLEPFLLSSASRHLYFAGVYAEQLVRSMFEYLVVLVVGLILGARMDIADIPVFILLSIIASISFYSMAILLSTVMVFTRDTFITQNTLAFILTLLCGVSFPVEYLPLPLQYLSNIFPMTHVLTIFRSCVINKTPLADHIVLIAVIAAQSVLYYAFGYVWFRKMESKLVEEVFS